MDKEYTATVTADITSEAVTFQDNIMGQALREWGFKREDIEKDLIELAAYRACMTLEDAQEIKAARDEKRLVVLPESLPHQCSCGCVYWQNYSGGNLPQGWCNLFHEILDWQRFNQYKKCGMCFAHSLTCEAAEKALEKEG